MIRLFLCGLILSPASRIRNFTAARSQVHQHSRTIASSWRTFDIMELDPQCPANAEDMKKDGSAEKDVSSKEEPTLPKLSSQEFRQFNHVAEHMNLYVSTLQHLPPCSTLKHTTAQPLPRNLERTLQRLQRRQKALRHEHPRLPARSRRILPPPHAAPYDRRTAHLPRAREEDASIQERAATTHSA